MTFTKLFAALMLTGTTAAFAQTPPATPPGQQPAPNAQQRIDAREANQQKRIDEGVKSGELTKREAERMQKGQARVQKMEDKANADGKITKNEARAIEKAQDNQSKRIYKEKHDKQHDRNHDGKVDRPAKK
jgi:polyhydroxyalkanoate synthesis regulator phasin